MKTKGRKVNENFGSMIRYLREKQGYSLKDLEDITGISPSYINRLERGTRACPSYPIIEKLAKALNADVTELLEISELSMTDGDVKFLGEIILSCNCRLTDEIATKEQKEKLVAIIDEIIYCQWEDDIVADLAEIGKLINEFKLIS
ncbi:helix-turn-helix transcriptional regulator [Tissierella pigra]|uniref:helix-turn-helix domain-containing protein n=1 Tax=Tissierella pigra TaxID=2607614 RepID=UPI001C110621|nr:helix-turn-helix transcriptional regulator [Tissierella pigra]MBU5428189.1 helix-turn-helix transcriptional regulator [Tissierella pigra]